MILTREAFSLLELGRTKGRSYCTNARLGLERTRGSSFVIDETKNNYLQVVASMSE